MLNTINVNVTYDMTAFSCIPLAFITAALVRGATDPYAIYQQFYSDIQSVATGGNGTAPCRLVFYNDILGVLAPKSVPMGTTGVVSYNVNPGPPVLSPGPFILFAGGFTYYMYVHNTVVVDGWATQKSPPGYSQEEITQLFDNATQLLSKKTPHLHIVRDITLTKAYLKDVSAFLRNSPYFGTGVSGSGAPFSSVEGEVNTRSKFFGVLIPFQATMPRASRYIDYTSGDPISNFGLSLWPDFPTSFYQGAVPPTYKFLDLDEVLYSMMLIWQDAVIQFINDSTTEALTGDTIANLLAGMQVPWSTFRIALRQQVLWPNADSQMLGQGLSPETSSGGFSPFYVEVIVILLIQLFSYSFLGVLWRILECYVVETLNMLLRIIILRRIELYLFLFGVLLRILFLLILMWRQ